MNTQDPWVIRDKWIVPASHKDRAIGMSTDAKDDKSRYAQVYAIVHDDRHGRHDSTEVGRRIVACVNACAGIPTDDLEASPNMGLFHLAEFANATVIQRDDLFAALKAQVAAEKYAKMYSHLSEAEEQIAEAFQHAHELRDAAIAKAEGLTP